MIYRRLSAGRFRLFPLRYRHSDALLGVCGLRISEETLREKLQNTLAECYRELDQEIVHDPEFSTAMSPLGRHGQSPIGREMNRVTLPFRIGPMAAVAGAIAERIVNALSDSCEELFCENGGDIAIRCTQNLKLSVFPGGPPFDRPILIKLTAGVWGIASSSGEFGHSFSRGQAQLATIISNNAALADAAATALANQVQPGCNPQALVEQSIPDIKAILIIHQDALYFRGDFELDF